MKDNNGFPNNSYAIASDIVEQTSKIIVHCKNEEKLKIEFEKLLHEFWKGFENSLFSQYETFPQKTVFRGRPDAVHGQVVVEYEAPGAFCSTKNIEHAYRQLITYLDVLSENNDERKKKTVGVGFDGEKIFFVKYNVSFVMDGPFPFDINSAVTFLTYLRALTRRALSADTLADTFGPKSETALSAVSALADALVNWSDPKVRVFFDEWKRLYGIVYGEQFNSGRDPTSLSKAYGIGKDVSFQELLFSIHTYFAFLMKLIVIELLTVHKNSFFSSFSSKLEHGAKQEIRNLLKNMEEGRIYGDSEVSNFLEGDFFKWYLAAMNPRLEDALRAIARSFSQFEPATSTIAPESTRDLLKKLYQYLVPQEVRHGLGEYYTPDWLAEMLLDEIGFNGNTTKRILDPACGSGTFIVLAIQRAREYAKVHNEPPLELAKRIGENIWGFDLNPLAVIASRTNYLFAMGDLVNCLPSFKIPVFLADSVLTPTRMGGDLFGEYLEISTSVGPFRVPAVWVRDKGFLLSRAVPLIESIIRENYSSDEAIKRMEKEGLVFPPHEQIIKNFYQDIMNLEKQGKNGIWARFLQNVFAPLMADKFDFVVGNPPWIRWGYLSREYREATLSLWKNYGLFSLAGHAARLGGGEKDFSMLFTYAAADYYLKKHGKLGFLITQEVLKSKGAGEGFRRFKLGDREDLKVVKAHDLVSVQPFEGAANKTALIILEKGEKTTYPVPYFLWRRESGTGRIPQELTFKQARPRLKKTKLFASPIGSPTGSWLTIDKNQTGLTKLEGKNPYKARLGARIEPYGVFMLEIKKVLSNGNLLVLNMPQKGKREIPEIGSPLEIEPYLVFPAVRGSDIKRWRSEPEIYILMVQDPQKSLPYPEGLMKREWPRTYGYLTNFKAILLSRGSKAVRQLAENTEFYAMYGIGDYTVARFKVIWKRMASDVSASVIAQFKTPFGYKMVIPTDTTSLIATDNENEAHYLCALINSNPIRDFIKSFSSAGRGFGAPSVMSHIGIPLFDKNLDIHKRLAEISRCLHDIKIENSRIHELEKELDNCVCRLLDL